MIIYIEVIQFGTFLHFVALAYLPQNSNILAPTPKRTLENVTGGYNSSDYIGHTILLMSLNDSAVKRLNV